MAPDFGFVINTHPDSDRVILVSPCSGHGFKHSPAIGESLAHLTGNDAVRPDLSAFRLARFERQAWETSCCSMRALMLIRDNASN